MKNPAFGIIFLVHFFQASKMQIQVNGTRFGERSNIAANLWSHWVIWVRNIALFGLVSYFMTPGYFSSPRDEKEDSQAFSTTKKSRWCERKGAMNGSFGVSKFPDHNRERFGATP